jgi:hypothetical protein
MCPPTTTCVLILLYVSSYYCICVLILLYMYTTVYVSSYSLYLSRLADRSLYPSQGMGPMGDGPHRGANIGISDQREAMAMTGTDFMDFKYRFSQTAGPHMVAAGGGLSRSQEGGGSAQESWRCLWGGGQMVGAGRSVGTGLQALQAAGMFAGNTMLRDGQVGQLAMRDEDVGAPANWAYRIAGNAGNGAN